MGMVDLHYAKSKTNTYISHSVLSVLIVDERFN